MNYIKITDVENATFFQFENSKVLGCLLNDIQGFEDGEPINSVEDIASPIGATAVNSKTGRRLATWVARFTCDVLENRRNMLAALRRTGFLKLVEFETIDGLDLRFHAYIDKVKAPYSSALNKPVLIQVEAPDPRFYSQVLHDVSIGRNTIGVADNVGNEQTSPVFRVHGPFTEFTITNLNNDQEITITETVLLGDYIEIDTVAHTIKLENGTSVYSSADGTPEFISMTPGENTFQFSDTGGGTGTELEVFWRDAYNGV